MRYPGSEKLEIIRLVEQSHLPVRRTLPRWGSCLGRFTGGMTACRAAGLKPWKTDHPAQAGVEPHPR
jgi:hypothetical protein